MVGYAQWTFSFMTYTARSSPMTSPL